MSSQNTVRIGSTGAEVTGETVPDDDCVAPPVAGNLVTNAELSADGCTLTAKISKDWCTSGEAQCEERTITLDFCNNGSTTVATGSLEMCECWVTGGPFCTEDTDYVTLAATATPTTP